MGSRKYPLLNDKTWLQTEYVDKKKSLSAISDIVGAQNHNSVRQALQRFGIAIRNISEGLTCHRDDSFRIDMDAIDGALLGDGFMQLYNKESNASYPSFEKKNKYKDHLQLTASALFTKNDYQISSEVEKRHNLVYYKFSTGTRKELVPIYTSWYSKNNNHTKHVPNDMRLSAKKILYWFMDDGSSSFRRKKSKTKQIRLCFCSESFSREEQFFLCEQMNGLGLHSSLRPCPWGYKWRIHIKQAEVEQFFATIGPPPCRSMVYKWK